MEVGSCVAGGLCVADDGGAEDGGAVAVGVAVVVGVGLAVALGDAELLVGAAAGGPKQPASANRAQNPRTLGAESLGLVMMPPQEAPRFRDLTFKVRRSRPPKQGLKSDSGARLGPAADVEHL